MHHTIKHIISGVWLLLLFAVVNMLVCVKPVPFEVQNVGHGAITAVMPVGSTVDSYLSLMPEESAKLLSELQLKLSARISRASDLFCLDASKQLGLSKMADCAAITIHSVSKTDHLFFSSHTLYYVYALRRIII